MGFIVPPSKWEIRHAAPIFAAQKYQAANDGRLPDTRMWRMLQFRHSLNANRFNFYHPNIGKMIETQYNRPPVPIVPPPFIPPDVPVPPIDPPPAPIVPPLPIVPPVPPDGGGTGTNPNPVVPQLPAVPEPSAFLMLAGAILVAGVGVVRLRRRSSERATALRPAAGQV
ncbi:PEP-CTERM sorting domain-containing protein [Paludisphaera sp.]|uniref:PEP-CTERM sorting domain-containing protein n=1 Tax=Paludisphaera sp. TaxID=2017432 RepID=UPI00301BD15F